ncbi:group II intron maturase-specific domain-containing protein [Paraburkholderia caffeinilytica]
MVELINPVLRGWVKYFAVRHSSECLSFILRTDSSSDSG